ncbi:hypothetical protein ACIQPR_09990 [Streptomyces sp. NPDC091280]|uniref:hypothetical protein n=1 Tax=Streptomyces sp. NPDC091280 TaxID=3365984 RepID=UPI0037FEEB30
MIWRFIRPGQAGRIRAPVPPQYWSGFKGDAQLLVETHYDAHLDFANWGTRRLILRWPAAVLSLDTVQTLPRGIRRAVPYTDWRAAWSCLAMAAEAGRSQPQLTARACCPGCLRTTTPAGQRPLFAAVLRQRQMYRPSGGKRTNEGSVWREDSAHPSREPAGQGRMALMTGQKQSAQATSRSPHHRLLVVDFDFFFHNPFEGLPAAHRGDLMLYDWAHAENDTLRETIWSFRAEDFLRAGVVPPRCEGYAGFWDRFTFTSVDPPLFYADSNMYAGRLTPAHFGLTGARREPWQEVHLFDAHHDSGYLHRNGPRNVEEWREAGAYSCEDWMLVHHDRGSRLTLTYPAWRPDGDEDPPWVPLNTDVDDGSPVPAAFDAVFLCRSGAWVPSWCDDQFTDLLDAFPGRAHLFPGSLWTHPRPDPLPAARRMAAVFAELRLRHADLTATSDVGGPTAPQQPHTGSRTGTSTRQSGRAQHGDGRQGAQDQAQAAARPPHHPGLHHG